MMKNVVLLQIETAYFSLFIRGTPHHAYTDAVSLLDSSSQLIIRGDYEGAEIFSPTRGALEPYISSICAPLFFEEQTYQILIRGKTEKSLEFYHANPRLRDAVGTVDIGSSLLMGNLNFGSEVGFSDLVVRVAGADILTICIEVFPSKMDYRRDFFEMLYEVNHEIHNLAFDFLKKTYLHAQLSLTMSQSLTEWYTILSMLFENLMKAVERISLAPRRDLIRSNRLRPIRQVRRTTNQTRSWLRKNSRRLIQCSETQALVTVDNAHLTAPQLPASKIVATFDTLENRFVKHVLEQIRRRLIDTRNRYVQSCGDGVPDVNLLQLFKRMEARIRRYQQQDFIRDAGELRRSDTFSLVLQFGAGYRDVLRMYIMLMRGLAIDTDIFKIALKDVWLLYEYWCFLKINQLLRQKHNLVTQDIIQVRGRDLVVRLRKGKTSRLIYCTQDGEAITLCYNSRPTNTFPTTAQQPDNIITLQKMGIDVRFQYILDAKYKLDCRAEYVHKFGSIGPQEIDINTMHRYRDAIVVTTRDEEIEHTIFGAYVLFPFADEARYRANRFFQSIKQVNVGGLPFLPKHTQLVEEFLTWLITATPNDVFERVILPRGIKTWINEQKLCHKPHLPLS